jgi:pimeloyl-ACP methyl ester carboxylesterase
MTTTSEAAAVAVPGGDLAYEVLTGTSEPVLAIHGISSHRRLWSWLHAEAPELTLVAPDLRGRADSIAVGGPFGMARHADDLAAVLDALGLDRVHVVGMSMGGFVAVHLAHRHAERVKSLVLVDGGFPMAAPPGLTRDNVSTAFADRVGRLGRTWESVDAFADYFCASTAPLLDRHDPLLRHYLEHDLRDGVVRLSGTALVADATDVFFGETPWPDVSVPIRFLHAEWSSGRDTPPAYPPAAVERYAAQCVSVVALEGLDHAGSIMTSTGARATAAALREARA